MAQSQKTSSKVKNSELWLETSPASAACGDLDLPSLERESQGHSTCSHNPGESVCIKRRLQSKRPGLHAVALQKNFPVLFLASQHLLGFVFFLSLFLRFQPPKAFLCGFLLFSFGENVGFAFSEKDLFVIFFLSLFLRFQPQKSVLVWLSPFVWRERWLW